MPQPTARPILRECNEVELLSALTQSRVESKVWNFITLPPNATVAYSSVGVAWWTNRYNGLGNGYDEAHAVAVDGNGNVYVAGNCLVTNRADFALVKYIPSAPRVAIAPDGGNGYFVRYAGLTDTTYRLQRAPSVTGPWSNIATNALEYHETSPLPGQAFYRTVQP